MIELTIHLQHNLVLVYSEVSSWGLVSDNYIKFHIFMKNTTVENARQILFYLPTLLRNQNAYLLGTLCYVITG